MPNVRYRQFNFIIFMFLIKLNSECCTLKCNLNATVEKPSYTGMRNHLRVRKGAIDYPLLRVEQIQ